MTLVNWNRVYKVQYPSRAETVVIRGGREEVVCHGVSVESPEETSGSLPSNAGASAVAQSCVGAGPARCCCHRYAQLVSATTCKEYISLILLNYMITREFNAATPLRSIDPLIFVALEYSSLSR